MRDLRGSAAAAAREGESGEQEHAAGHPARMIGVRHGSFSVLAVRAPKHARRWGIATGGLPPPDPPLSWVRFGHLRRRRAAMQGLMSSYPLTLTHVFQRAERIFPEKGIATVTGGGIERTTYGEWAERTRRLAGVLDTLEISVRRPRRHVRLEHRPPPRALLRRALQRSRPAHAQYPPVPRRRRLHRQPRRGRGRLRRPLAAEAAVAAGRPLRDRQARRRDGRRRGRGDPRRPARARLRGRCWRPPTRSISR